MSHLFANWWETFRAVLHLQLALGGGGVAARPPPAPGARPAPCPRQGRGISPRTDSHAGLAKRQGESEPAEPGWATFLWSGNKFSAGNSAAARASLALCRCRANEPLSSLLCQLCEGLGRTHFSLRGVHDVHCSGYFSSTTCHTVSFLVSKQVTHRYTSRCWTPPWKMLLTLCKNTHFYGHLGSFFLEVLPWNACGFFRNVIDANVFSNHQMASFAAFL